MALKRLILIRAAETDWNLHGRWQGWVPSPLNEHGWVQAHRLAGFVRNIGLTRLYTSDTRRAVQTADVIAERIGLEAIRDERLRERHIGHWQGLVLPEVRDWFADEYAEMLNDVQGFRIPGGGESVEDVRRRVSTLLEEIINDADASDVNHTIGLVSHTTTIRAILSELLPERDLSREQLGNTSVTTVRWTDEGRWKLTAINDTSHLEGLESRFMPEVENSE